MQRLSVGTLNTNIISGGLLPPFKRRTPIIIPILRRTRLGCRYWKRLLFRNIRPDTAPLAVPQRSFWRRSMEQTRYHFPLGRMIYLACFAFIPAFPKRHARVE